MQGGAQAPQMQRQASQPSFPAVTHASSMSNLPSMVSVTDSSSDGGDNVATVAIPMARVAEALAQRRPSTSANPAVRPTQAGVGLPRLHEDQPNMGTQLIGQGQMRPNAGTPTPQRMGTMALPTQQQQTPMPQSFTPQGYAKPGVQPTMPGSQSAYQSSPSTPLPGSVGPVGGAPSNPNPVSSSSGSARQGGGMSQGPNPIGPGGTSRVAPIRLDEPSAPGDLQTSVYRRNDPIPVATVVAPQKRSRAMLFLGMLAFLVLGFAIVAAVVGLVTHRFPFVQ